MKFIKNYSLSISLFTLFLISWTGQAYFQYRHLEEEAQTHKQELKITEFIDGFLASTLENWQSEFLQLFSFVVLATYFVHKGSPQSKDSDEQMQRSIDQIKKKLKIKG